MNGDDMSKRLLLHTNQSRKKTKSIKCAFRVQLEIIAVSCKHQSLLGGSCCLVKVADAEHGDTVSVTAPDQDVCSGSKAFHHAPRRVQAEKSSD